jgi:uncharacterized protein YceH (UPF0502 family)
VEPDAAEIRVLGCLIEKQRTTPDAYPLTLNSLRLACNQSTNRDPLVDYDEGTIRDALERLGKRGWTRLATWSNRRTMKYRHLFDEALGLSEAETALLCVLMLRGPQTSGELKPRSERLHPFPDTGEVERVLEGLSERGLVGRLDRRPGERGRRYAQLLGGGGEESADQPAASPDYEAPPAAPGLEDRVARLEAQLDELRSQVEELRR